jgi:hypothetical protein
MSFPLNSPLSIEEIKFRQQGLVNEIGLSESVIEKFQKITKNLCDVTRAQRRIQNLKDLGFDVENFVVSNPKILIRKSVTVRRKFKIVRAWFLKLGIDEDLYKLFEARPQLWSVSPRKLHIICLLAINMEGVTAGRICNMVTLNLESIICTFADEQSINFQELFTSVRRRDRDMYMSDVTKHQYIIQHEYALPKLVYKKYIA